MSNFARQPYTKIQYAYTANHVEFFSQYGIVNLETPSTQGVVDLTNSGMGIEMVFNPDGGNITVLLPIPTGLDGAIIIFGNADTVGTYSVTLVGEIRDSQGALRTSIELPRGFGTYQFGVNTGIYQDAAYNVVNMNGVAPIKSPHFTGGINVVGGTVSDTIQLTTGAAADLVLASDASGHGTWTSLTAAGGAPIHNPAFTGTMSFDSGAVTSDGNGNVTTVGAINANAVNSTTVNAGVLNVSGTSSLDGGAITTDGSGNISANTLVASEVDCTTSSVTTLSGAPYVEATNGFNSNGDLVAATTFHVYGTSWLDSGAITTDGSGNLSVGGNLQLAGSIGPSSGTLSINGNFVVLGTSAAQFYGPVQSSGLQSTGTCSLDSGAISTDGSGTMTLPHSIYSSGLDLTVPNGQEYITSDNAGHMTIDAQYGLTLLCDGGSGDGIALTTTGSNMMIKLNSNQVVLPSISQYLDNAGAISGGLPVGCVYYTNVGGDGILKVVI